MVNTKEQNGSDTTYKMRKYDERSRPIPFFLAAVSVCDIQAFTENRFAKKGQTENQKTDRKACHIRGILMYSMQH